MVSDMPFKSREQETYLRINEPEIHQRWVDNYGHYNESESYYDVATMQELVAWLKENNLEPTDIEGFTPDGEVILKPLIQRAKYKEQQKKKDKDREAKIKAWKKKNNYDMRKNLPRPVRQRMLKELFSAESPSARRFSISETWPGLFGGGYMGGNRVRWKYRDARASVRFFAEKWGVDLKALSEDAKKRLDEYWGNDVPSGVALSLLIEDFDLDAPHKYEMPNEDTWKEDIRKNMKSKYWRLNPPGVGNRHKGAESESFSADAKATRGEDEIMDDIMECYGGLSPENIAADGERSWAEQGEIYDRLYDKLDKLWAEIGREVGEAEAYEWMMDNYQADNLILPFADEKRMKDWVFANFPATGNRLTTRKLGVTDRGTMHRLERRDAEEGCNTYTCRTEIGGMHEGSDGQRFKKLLNIMGATNIKIKEDPIDDDAPATPFSKSVMGVVYFTFDVCSPQQYNNLETLKAGLGQMMEHEPFLDLHRCWQTLAEGTEANEEWYSAESTEKPLLPRKCERCGSRSRFPLRTHNVQTRHRLAKTTAGDGEKLICAKCEQAITKQIMIGDPAYEKFIRHGKYGKYLKIPTPQNEQAADSKKMPAAEKAVIGGATTGATMEGLEALLLAEEGQEDWKGMKFDSRFVMNGGVDSGKGEWRGWSYEDGDITVGVDGPNGHISTNGKRELTIEEARAFLNSKGIPFDNSTDCSNSSCIHEGDWDLVYFNYPNHEKCYKHDWSQPLTKQNKTGCVDIIHQCNYPYCSHWEIIGSKDHSWGDDYYVRDTQYEDGEARVVISQDCDRCGVNRRGHADSEVIWDFEAEGKKAKIAGVGNFRIHTPPTPEPKYDEKGRKIRKCRNCLMRGGRRHNGRRRKTKESVRKDIEKGYYDEGDWVEVKYWCPSSRIMFPREGEGEMTTPHEWTDWEYKNMAAESFEAQAPRGHKMMTAALGKKIPPLYSQDGKGDEAIVYAHYFNPYGIGEWWILEWDGKDEMFGYADLGFPELGGIWLSELEKASIGGMELPIERDLHWQEKTLGEVKQAVSKYRAEPKALSSESGKSTSMWHKSDSLKPLLAFVGFGVIGGLIGWATRETMGIWGAEEKQAINPTDPFQQAEFDSFPPIPHASEVVDSMMVRERTNAELVDRYIRTAGVPGIDVFNFPMLMRRQG